MEIWWERLRATNKTAKRLDSRFRGNDKSPSYLRRRTPRISPLCLIARFVRRSKERPLENRRLSFDFAAHAATLRLSGKNLDSRQIPFVLSVARAKSKHERPDTKGASSFSLPYEDRSVSHSARPIVYCSPQNSHVTVTWPSVTSKSSTSARPSATSTPSTRSRLQRQVKRSGSSATTVGPNPSR